MCFFVGSATCVGVVLAYNNPTLAAFIDDTSPGSDMGSSSPYPIVTRLEDIKGLVYLTNATIFDRRQFNYTPVCTAGLSTPY